MIGAKTSRRIIITEKVKKFEKFKKVIDKVLVHAYNNHCSVEKSAETCTSGSVVEYRLAKARVAGSNPVSCFLLFFEKPLIFLEIKGFLLTIKAYLL